MSESATLENTPTETPNKVEITDAGPCLKKLSIQIPAETVDQQLGLSLDTLINEAALPGFRKGRAPRRLVEKRFGSAMRGEAKKQLASAAFSQAVEEHKLRIIGEPASEDFDKVEVVPGKPMDLEFEVEVVPEFDMPSIEGIDIKKPVIEIQDQTVEREFERALKNEGELEPQDTPQHGDYLTGHAVMKDADGVTHIDLREAVVQIPEKGEDKGMILGIMVDDFATQIKLPKPGESFTVKTKGPDQHETEAIRGADLTITFQVDRADRIIPATPESIAERYGLESPDAVKQIVRERIEQRAQVEQQTAMRQQIARYLLDNINFDLPERITAGQAQRNLDRKRLELMHMGHDPATIETHIAELRAASQDSAARELKLFFILERVASEQSVQVTEAEVNARIHQIAVNRQARPEKLRQELISTGRIGNVVQQIKEHKAMDVILNKAKITEVPAEEFNSLMESAGGSDTAEKPEKTAKKKTSKKKTTKKASNKKED